MRVNAGLCVHIHSPEDMLLQWIFNRRHYLIQYFKNILFIYFLQRGREKERERNICVWLPLVHPIGDLVCNPGKCPDQESNQRPFGSHASAQSTEPHQPGLQYFKDSTLKHSFPGLQT